MDNSLTFSKIVATPNLNSWAQAYNAGKLFAVLSLEKTEDLEEIESLNIQGKQLLERLEQEFFATEDKNLESIKKAISVVFEQEIKGVNISFVAGALVNNILYLFGIGSGKVFIKRGENLGLALNSEEALPKDITSSSGFIKEGDLIVLATEAFSQVVTEEDLNINLNDIEPSEITESLAPKIHKAENGKIAAIVIKYKRPFVVEEVVDEETEANEPEVIPQEEIEEKPTSNFKEYLFSLKSKIRKPDFRQKSTKKLFLILAVIIIGILSFSIFLGIQNQNNAKVKALFDQIYPQAQKEYEEGLSLVDLNKNYARESFQSAQKILNDNKGQFKEKSEESIQTQDLLKKIEEGLMQVSPIDKSGLDRSKLSIIVENGSGIEGTAGKGAAILKDLGYNVISTGNADNYKYEGVTIEVKSDKEDFLNLLKKDLAKDYTIKSSSSDLPDSSTSDCVIIIGK
jgi:hypothetical protein